MKRLTLLVALWGFVFCTGALAQRIQHPAVLKPEKSRFTVQEEIIFGEMAMHSEENENSHWLKNSPIQEYVDRVLQNLESVAPAYATANVYYGVRIYDYPWEGAWSLSSGCIGITLGMLRRVTTEDELAWVIAHEMGHVALRHPGSEKDLREQLENQHLSPARKRRIEGLIKKHDLNADMFGVQRSLELGYNPSLVVPWLIVDEMFLGDKCHFSPWIRVREILEEMRAWKKVHPSWNPKIPNGEKFRSFQFEVQKLLIKSQ